jgi:hypothetical protein
MLSFGKERRPQKERHGENEEKHPKWKNTKQNERGQCVFCAPCKLTGMNDKTPRICSWLRVI